MLKTKDTFTAWVESKQLQGAQLREALSIARALDLATHWYGAEYLVTDSAEVQLRRLLSVALAAKLGNYKLSQFLEEVPGDSALAELPDDVLRSLSQRLKFEMKLEPRPQSSRPAPPPTTRTGRSPSGTRGGSRFGVCGAISRHYSRQYS